MVNKDFHNTTCSVVLVQIIHNATAIRLIKLKKTVSVAV